METIHQFMHNTFWVDGEISFIFTASEHLEKDAYGKNINLDDFLAFLGDQGYHIPDLETINDTHQDQNGQSSTHHFLEYSHDTFPDKVTNFIRFISVPFLKEPPAGEQANEQTLSADQSMEFAKLSDTPVAHLVNYINAHLSELQTGAMCLQNGRQLGPIPIISAAPNWNCGASNSMLPDGYVTTGCPLTPPIPLSGDAKSPYAPGLWPFQLPTLPIHLKKMTGDGVTVIVLDSLPPLSDIQRAAEAAREHNLLLLDLLHNVTFTYPTLPESLDQPGEKQVKTGRDIKGRVIGLRMPDHGLFIAGIIRDIAPQARVECVRVLNDFCAGTVQVLITQLHAILIRTSAGHDLHGKDVVINMSLVIPSAEDVQGSGINLDIAHLDLFFIMQALASRGVIFTASAGNEGDSRYMQPEKKHPDALYPAAFAYPFGNQLSPVETMIPVGAVNCKKEASAYSCYPGSRGVSTYGGETPSVYSVLTNEKTGMTVVDTHQIDAITGVYTQLSYPSLSFDDPEAFYPAPNAQGWAYWTGTSFATPIVSALMARALELRRRNPSLHLTDWIAETIQYISQGQTVSWQLDTTESVPGPMVLAVQEQPFERNYEHTITFGSPDRSMNSLA